MLSLTRNRARAAAEAGWAWPVLARMLASVNIHGLSIGHITLREDNLERTA